MCFRLLPTSDREFYPGLVSESCLWVCRDRKGQNMAEENFHAGEESVPKKDSEGVREWGRSWESISFTSILQSFVTIVVLHAKMPWRLSDSRNPSIDPKTQSNCRNMDISHVM